MERMNFRFVVKEAQVEMRNGNQSYATIVLEDIRRGVFVVHPVTDFIRSRYGTKTNYNTQKAPAETIKRFLNWLFFENHEIYGLNTFEHLQIKHAVEYLNYLGEVKQNKRGTIKGTENYLTEFYYFLQKRGVIPEIVRRIPSFNGKKTVLESPFSSEGLAMPTRNLLQTRLNDFPSLELVQLFLETARDVTPEIAFGIYLQFFGGIRRGEIVNLDRGSIQASGPYGSGGMTVEIIDRPELFARIRDASKNSVKNPRNQSILFTPMLPVLYKHHLNWLEVNAHSKKNDPLFIDKSGNAMSGAVYEQRFMSVKKAFMERLLRMKSPHTSYLNKYTWGTHIGRGIFTNIAAKFIAKTPQELALIRGDRTLDTALRYMSSLRIQKEINQGLDDIFKF
ncbi:hypothetical protein [Paenibacillus polymyxa]|uniref:hypothetical protein n=1 Tax=Paenibacillus polymyxa TaxID=1406 RepID=UPI00202407AC|nr:hypothetical protein [Paenibacillus polymyxa]MDU8672515.1 hypothetical protein [Paenibacillus polymyxa]MDU8697422.1 hypothetical protein [Paenibacillus polymyxa]URJ71095.1 hypothetical protein MF624_001247 [Paenibacillus polymyxa]WDZ61503.1 hypothetical protein MF620_08115 [Paenibacillus polymyxa]WEC95172.1 hypothetical protein MF623_07815 [Paenibacillus polymyxa]